MYITYVCRNKSLVLSPMCVGCPWLCIEDAIVVAMCCLCLSTVILVYLTRDPLLQAGGSGEVLFWEFNFTPGRLD